MNRPPPRRSLLFRAALAAALAAAAAPWAAPAGTRNFRTFLPKPGDRVEAPAAQLVQLLLDRQEREGYDSYMVQVLFRGKPPGERAHRVFADRVEIDFFDTGKPSMRLAKVRGGGVEASSLEELCYRDTGRTQAGGPVLRRMVRLTLFTREKPDLKFRDTLDRTLIHFRMQPLR